jgi:8-oxo-dGTP pyrophosphatase MutT (NUDIX family)
VEYVKTIAQSTSYACLYFTDSIGRPVQLRSSYGGQRWQFPGGNMDLGESPWECALRECREETGIDFTGEQRLLGVQFIAPRGDEWPCSHIGFIFDGGRLTDDQLDRIVLTEEHTEWEARTLEEWRQEMSARNFARLRFIDHARRTGTVVYVEGAA